MGKIAQNGNITDCGNAGTVSGSWSEGGIVEFTGKESTAVQNCYNIGAVSSDQPKFAGGIVGSHYYGWIRSCYWLTGTAKHTEGFIGDAHLDNSATKTAAEFANGTVLNLLKNNRTDSPWVDECKYVAAAGMTLPVFKGQGDSHDHNFEWKHTDTEHWKECDCGAIEANSTASHKEETGICTEGIKCECGYEMIAAKSEHNWSDWVHNTTSHTRNC